MRHNEKEIYISGPLTDTPDWRERFAAAYARLKEAGWGVVHNPVDISDGVDTAWQALGKRPKYADYMRADLAMLIRCGAVYMLEGWESSRGAKLELGVAEALGMDIYYEGDGDGLRDDKASGKRHGNAQGQEARPFLERRAVHARRVQGDRDDGA